MNRALGLVVNWPTALAALGPLRWRHRGQTVLIHAAAGGTDQAAVKMAKHYGATVIATASPGKHGGDGRWVPTMSSTPAAPASSPRSCDRPTERAPTWCWSRSAAPPSTPAWPRPSGSPAAVVVYGVAGGDAAITNWELVYKHQIHVIGLNIGILIQAAPQIFGEVMRQLFELLAAGVLGPASPPSTTWPSGPKALAELESRATVGKLALRP